MSDLIIADATGNELRLTVDVDRYGFDTVTCSPHADGFTMLNSLVGNIGLNNQLLTACSETERRNEVCILSGVQDSRSRKVLLTPTIKSLEPDTRLSACKLMKELFRASQAEGVEAGALLITHFFMVRRYPETHVQGIFDAIHELSGESFLRLKLVGFWIDEKHLARFTSDLQNTFPNARG